MFEESQLEPLGGVPPDAKDVLGSVGTVVNDGRIIQAFFPATIEPLSERSSGFQFFCSFLPSWSNCKLVRLCYY